jgi:hypothetical protein
MHHFYDVQKGGVAERFPPEADRECIVFVSNKMEGWQRGSRQRRTGNASFSFQIKWRVGREVECTAFEKQNLRKGVTGSNPVPSAVLSD